MIRKYAHSDNLGWADTANEEQHYYTGRQQWPVTYGRDRSKEGEVVHDLSLIKHHLPALQELHLMYDLVISDDSMLPKERLPETILGVVRSTACLRRCRLEVFSRGAQDENFTVVQDIYEHTRYETALQLPPGTLVSVETVIGPSWWGFPTNKTFKTSLIIDMK